MCFLFSVFYPFFSFLPHLHSLHSERALWWLHSQALGSKGKQTWGCLWSMNSVPSDLCVMILRSRVLSISLHCTMRAHNWASRNGKAQSECTDSPNTMQEHEAETNLLMLNSISLVSSPADGTQLFHHMHVPTSAATDSLRATPFTFWVGLWPEWGRQPALVSLPKSEPFTPENLGCHFYCFFSNRKCAEERY